MVGKNILHYNILEKLGEGGMGLVYKAKDTKLDRMVAIKFLPRQVAANTEVRERFKIEAKAAAALNHPNVAQIYAIEEAGEEIFLVMEYIEGRELKELIYAPVTPTLAREEAGGLSLQDVIKYTFQIAEGLEAAHKKGIIHRDIKSSNIMLTESGRIKIMDFGLAKVTGGGQFTKVGSTLGTADYMSPEQARGEDVDHRTDIWSLGVLLYEMLTSRLPFTGDYEPAVIYSILHEEPDKVSRVDENIPEMLEQIVQKSLKKDPEERYSNIDELMGDLNLLREDSFRPVAVGLSQTKPESSSAEKGKRRTGIFNGERKSKRKMYTLIATVLIVAIISVWLFLPIQNIFFNFVNFGDNTGARHIAVLPFTNIGQEPGSQAFCDGLVATLTSKLSQLEQFQGNLWVVPASEMRRSGVVSASDARAAFGTNIAIDGSVQSLQDRLRLTINLIDAKLQRQLDSKLIDEPKENIIILQDEAVIKVAEMLQIQLQPRMRELINAGGTSVASAYDLYLKGRGNLQRYDKPENIDTAIDLFKQALSEDPNYSLAYAGLGEAYLEKYRATKEVQFVEYAARNCQHAVELDSLVAPGHVALGSINIETGKYDEAIDEFKKAVELDPGNADAYRGLANTYMKTGRLDEAERTFTRAIEMKPDFWVGYNDLGRFYIRHGRYEDALLQYEKVIELTPRNAKGYSNLGAAYYFLNQRQKAIQAFEKALEIQPKYSIYSNLATLYYYEAQYKNAARMYEKALEMQDTDYKVWGNLAAAYEYVPGEKDKSDEANKMAIKLAEKILEINPQDPDVLSNLAGYYNDIADEKKAKSLLEKAVEIIPNDAQIIFRIGYLYEQMNQRELALKWIENAVIKGYALEEIENNPGLIGLRSDSRFKKIMQLKNTN